jgi:pyruvate,orthophosphate dikinase
MVPLVNFVEEIRTIRRWVEQSQDALPGGQAVPVKVGAMVETPAAALSADSLATECDFLSFGTNDLTQFSLGLSREDYPPVLQSYRQRNLLRRDPFQSLHPTVLKIVRDAASRAKQIRPSIILGLCGAHATDPQVLELCRMGLLDYLSVPRHQLLWVKLQAIQGLWT